MLRSMQCSNKIAILELKSQVSIGLEVLKAKKDPHP